MLEPFRAAPGLARRYAMVCDLLGFDPMVEARHDPDILNRNRVSSLLTVIASVSAMELEPCAPMAVAGYSIGQWTALHAAGMVDEIALVSIVDRRARLMDDALEAQPPSGMLAVIGIPLPRVEEMCAEARARGDRVAISNVNAPRQLTLGGEVGALDRIEEVLRAGRVRRLIRVPVAGAWHGDFMLPAVDPFAGYLATRTLALPHLPIIDNVTGEAWRDTPTPRELALHLARPVLWAPGVETLRNAGASHLVEMGYGNTLTKFGFFIDRNLAHRAVAPPPRQRQA